MSIHEIPDSEEERLKLPERDADNKMTIDEPSSSLGTDHISAHFRRSSIHGDEIKQETKISQPINEVPNTKSNMNARSKRQKPGPGRSSEPVADTSRAEGKVKVKTPRKKQAQTTAETVQEVLEVANQLQSDGAKIDKVAFNSQNESGAGVPNVEVPVAQPVVQVLSASSTMNGHAAPGDGGAPLTVQPAVVTSVAASTCVQLQSAMTMAFIVLLA
jgi:hypothetical protein